MKRFTFLLATLYATTFVFAAVGTRVTDPAMLKAGDTLAITNYDGTRALSTTQTETYREVTEFNASNVSKYVELIELVASNGNWKLKVADGYLSVGDDAKNQLTTVAEADAPEWTIFVKSDSISFQAVDGNKRIICYNLDARRFASYKSENGLQTYYPSLYIISGKRDESDFLDRTIAEFIETQGGRCYLEGVVSDIVDEEYGNFTLTDNSGSIEIYGCLTADKEEQKFNTLGVAEGDTIRVIAETYVLYASEIHEAKDVIYVSHKKNTGGKTVEITGLVYADAYWDTDYEYWVFDLYKDYDEKTEETLFPEVYFSATGGTDKSIAGVEYVPEEYDFGWYVKSKGDTVDFVAATVSVICTAEGEYYFNCTFTGSDSNEYSFKLSAEVMAWACTWNDELWDYDYEAILLEDVPTAVRSIEIDENVYARNGRIYAEEGARIYTLTGLDVTRQNGTLNGVYVVRTNSGVAKVIVRK